MILLLGFLVSTFVSTLAIAETQDDRFRINSVTGELETPVVRDLKSSNIIGEYLTLNSQRGIFVPAFLHQKYILNRPGNASTLTQRRRLLNAQFTEHDAWEASVSK